MRKTSKLKKYAELFKRNISKFLAPGISVSTVIYPVEQNGAVFEFMLLREGRSNEKVESLRKSVGVVLSQIPQRLIGGNIENVTFSGTNLYLEGNRILVIKGDDTPEAWNNSAVLEDVQRVVSTSMGGKPL